jgi:hypothetical protein
MPGSQRHHAQRDAPAVGGTRGWKSRGLAEGPAGIVQLEDKVPGELKPAFEKLRAYTESAGSDFSKFGEPEFEELLKPIEHWMDKNCK